MYTTQGKYLWEFPPYLLLYHYAILLAHQVAYRVSKSGCHLGGNIRLYLFSSQQTLAEVKAKERGLISITLPTSLPLSQTQTSTLWTLTTSRTRDDTTY